MAQHQAKPALDTVDPVWMRIRREAEEIVRRGAARHGLTWHYNRPPVIGLDYEMDCRGVAMERVVGA